MKNATSSTTGISTDQARSTDKAYDAGNSDTQERHQPAGGANRGTLIANTNDFKGPIRKIIEDAQSYYEITYDPQITKYDGSFRRVR